VTTRMGWRWVSARSMVRMLFKGVVTGRRFVNIMFRSEH
jgi:hypothetical protein